MKKLIIVMISVVLLLGFFVFNGLDDQVSKKQIFQLVEANAEDMKADIKSNDFTFTLQLGSIKKVNMEDDGIVDFYCGGAGFGSSTQYSGFYWSENDNISGMWCAGPEEEIKPEGVGFAYHEAKGDNYYYTEKICDHFYYYKASF